MALGWSGRSRSKPPSCLCFSALELEDRLQFFSLCFFFFFFFCTNPTGWQQRLNSILQVTGRAEGRAFIRAEGKFRGIMQQSYSGNTCLALQEADPVWTAPQGTGERGAGWRNGRSCSVEFLFWRNIVKRKLHSQKPHQTQDHYRFQINCPALCSILSTVPPSIWNDLFRLVSFTTRYSLVVTLKELT